MKSKKSLYITLGLVLVLLLLGANACSTYQKLVETSENATAAYAEVENQYQRRFDLIPNLVNTVKGYATHEKSTLEDVVLARSGQLLAANDSVKAMQATPADGERFERYTQAQAALQRQAMVYVNALHEAYPDLKANQNFEALQVELAGTENRVATARRRYVESVRNYNVTVRRFPGNIWAPMFGFEPMAQFAAEEGAASAPKVTF